MGDSFFSFAPYRWVLFLFLCALLFQVPFSELISWKSSFPFIIRKEEWPLNFLHLFQSLCVFGVLAVFYQRLKKSYWKRPIGWGREGLFFFIAVVSYWLYWTPLGFDVTDEGRRMAHSWFMFEGLWNMHVDFRMGGHILNGLWLHVLPGPSLLWGRFGYALLKSGMGLLTFLIIRNAFPDRRFGAFFFAFLGMLIVSVYSYQAINYKNLPMFLVLGSVLSFQLAGDDGKRAFSSKAAFIGGFLLPWAVLSRFPLLLILGAPLLWQFLAHYVKRSERWTFKPSLRWTALGSATGVLLVVLLLGMKGSLGDFWNTIHHKLIQGFITETNDSLKSHGHDPASLLQTYKEDLQRIFPLLLYELGFFFVLGLIFRFLKAGRAFLLPLSAIAGCIVIWWFVGLDHRYHGLLALPIGLLLFYILSKRKRPPSIFVAYWGGLLFCYSFVGSNNGILSILITGGGILFFSYALMLLSAMSSDQSFKRLDPAPVLGACSLFIPLYILDERPHTIYRDAEQGQLTRMMNDPVLFGIFSEPARVQKVNGILKAMDDHITPYEENLLVANTAPMFHFITEAPYSFNKHWQMKGETPTERRHALNEPIGPDHILLMRVDPRDWDWPDVSRPTVPRDRPYYRFYKDYLKSDVPYRKVFYNKPFSLYNRREEK